jgi:hypothetical protein
MTKCNAYPNYMSVTRGSRQVVKKVMHWWQNEDVWGSHHPERGQGGAAHVDELDLTVSDEVLQGADKEHGPEWEQRAGTPAPGSPPSPLRLRLGSWPRTQSVVTPHARGWFRTNEVAGWSPQQMACPELGSSGLETGASACMPSALPARVATEPVPAHGECIVCYA